MTFDEPDTYRISGEHVAVLMTPAWQTLGPALARALSGMPTDSGPVLDVGAGTGPGTRVVADTLPGVEVLAVEPDRGLRTALLATVATDPDLRNRVTVVPTDLLATTWPDHISGLVALNVLGHFAPEERAEVWRRVADRLGAGGRVVLDLLPPHTADPVPPFEMSAVTVGRRRYAGTARATPVGPGLLAWQMDYRVEEQGVEIDTATARYEFHVLTPEALAAEVAEAGLVLTVGRDGGLATVTR